MLGPDYLIFAVTGNPDQQFRGVTPDLVTGQVAVAQMHPVGLAEQGNIQAVIDNQQGSGFCGFLAEDLGLGQEGAAGGLLVAQLDDFYSTRQYRVQPFFVAASGGQLLAGNRIERYLVNKFS